MKLKEASITILVEKTGARLELRDSTSGCQIAEVFVKPDDFMAALGRLAYVPCQVEVFPTNHLNKKMITETLEFPWDGDRYAPGHAEKLYAEAKRVCPKGWVPDVSCSSQNSHFMKNGKPWFRTTIRTWKKEA